MKPPTKPPAAPPSNRGFDEPPSGRARKDVNYTPVPSASLRAKPPLPSASMQPAGDPAAAYDDDLIEDMATPTRTPQLPQSQPMPFAPPASQPVPFAPPPSQPVPPGPMPPPSERSFQPPSHPSLAPFNTHTPPSQQAVMHPSGSMARVRQPTPMDMPRPRIPTPMDTPPYGSQNGPASQQHITGPQMPIPVTPNTGSFRTVGDPPPTSRRPAVEDGVPLGYVVASAFFLAIALVGFGLYLAFEVISL